MGLGNGNVNLECKPSLIPLFINDFPWVRVGICNIKTSIRDLFFFFSWDFFFCGNEQILRERLKCLGIFPFAAHNPPGAVGVHCHQPGQRLHPGGEPAPGGERGSSTPHILLFWAKIPGIWLFTTPFATRALLAAAPS